MKIIKYGNNGYMNLYKIQDPKDGEVAAVYLPNVIDDWPNLLFYKYYKNPGVWSGHKIDGVYFGRIEYTPVFWFGDGKMKVIFLDIGGVLNNREVFNRKKSQGLRVWDEKCIDRLNRITNETGAKIVISSTWRRSEDLYSAIVNEMGITGEIIGKTIDFLNTPNTERCDEIEEWLSRHSDVTTFIILDDDADMGHLLFHLFQTITEFGLTDDYVESAIKRLNNV